MNSSPELMRMKTEKTIRADLEAVPPEKRPDCEKLLQLYMKTLMQPSKADNYKGYRLLPGISTATVEYACDKFEPKEGDVVVASFGKTGTTWLTEIVRQLLYRKDEKLLESAKNISQFFSYLEFGPGKKYHYVYVTVWKYQILENMKFPRRFLGTHLSPSLLNLEKFREKGAKILYIIRNPKDQAVSWYHFSTSLPFKREPQVAKVFPKSEREFYNFYLTGQQPVMSKDGEGYLEHVRAWYDHKNDSNIMFLVYEEMKQNIDRELRKIAEFIGVDLTDAEFDEVIERTSFKTMKSSAQNGANVGSMLNIFRKGQVGGWKSHLTVAQSELIDSNVDRILGDTDISFIY